MAAEGGRQRASWEVPLNLGLVWFFLFPKVVLSNPPWNCSADQLLYHYKICWTKVPRLQLLKIGSALSESSVISKRICVQGHSPERCLKLWLSVKILQQNHGHIPYIIMLGIWHVAKPLTEWFIKYDPILVKINGNNDNVRICRENNWRKMHQNVNNDYLGMGVKWDGIWGEFTVQCFPQNKT